jgi:hypothetical protein
MCKSLKQINFVFSVEKRPGSSKSNRKIAETEPNSILLTHVLDLTHVYLTAHSILLTHVLDRSLDTPNTCT